MPIEVTYFTVSDARYFLRRVGLVNSLRLTGNHQPIVVLDGGFTPEQRDLLACRQDRRVPRPRARALVR